MSAHLAQLPLPKKVAALQAARTEFVGPAKQEPVDSVVPQSYDIDVCEVPHSVDRRIAAWCRGSWGWLASMAIHALLVLALGLMTLAVQSFDGSTMLVVDAGSMDREEVVPTIITDLVTPDMAASGSTSSAMDANLSITAGGDFLAPLSELAKKSAGQGGGEGVHSGPTSEAMAVLKLDGTAVAKEGDGTGETDNGSDTGQAEFFGIQASGRDFVFVVDSSGSMQGQKWRRACRELIQSIERLGPEQSFCVFFFDVGPHLMFNQSPDELTMLKPTKQNVTKLKRWMISIDLGNATKPLVATRLALAMEPDALFLLSDGEFQDDTPAFLRIANLERDEDGVRPKTVVHTVCFKSVAGAGTLKMVADENGGNYRFVK